jgi:DNA (cytosine-5)-methyltransferase 1
MTAPLRPTSIDLFSGAGGLALGFEQAGFDVLVAVESDPVHLATHSYNFPHTEHLLADVATIAPSELVQAVDRGAARTHRESPQRIDVVFGGPPCQGFSAIGKRLSDDHRNQLVFHFFRLVSSLRPRFFVMENVPGMAMKGRASTLDQLIREFDAIGYSVVRPIRILRAPEYGVPQDRRRLFLIGADVGEDLPLYPEATHRARPRHGQEKSDAQEIWGLPFGPTVWDAIGDLPEPTESDPDSELNGLRMTAEAQQLQLARLSRYARDLRGWRDPEDYSVPRRWDPTVITGQLSTVHTDRSQQRFIETPPGVIEAVSRSYRLHPNGLANTLRAGTGKEHGSFTSPRPLHPTQPRVITVREAARLHSFPDWFRFHATKWHGLRQIGNAVPPLLGRSVARSIRDSMRVTVERPTEAVSLGDPVLLGLNSREATTHFGLEAQEKIVAYRNANSDKGAQEIRVRARSFRASDREERRTG